MRRNSDLCHLHHKLIGFYNRDEKCLLRGTNWVFKWRCLCFVFKGLSHAPQFVHRMLKVNSSCCTPVIKGSHWTIFLQFGIKASFKKPRNLRLRLRMASWRFWSWLTVLEWLKLISRHQRTMTGKGSEHATAGQGIVSMLACYKEILSEKKRSVTSYTSVTTFSVRATLRLVHRPLVILNA